MGARKLGDIIINKRTDTTLTLHTKNKYVYEDNYFTIGAQSAEISSGTSSADIDVNSTPSGSVNSTNISDVIGTKSSTKPTNGYYVCFDGSGSVTPAVTKAGWVDTGSLDTFYNSTTKYFPVSAATITQNAPTVNASGLVTATTSTTAATISTLTSS